MSRGANARKTQKFFPIRPDFLPRGEGFPACPPGWAGGAGPNDAGGRDWFGLRILAATEALSAASLRQLVMIHQTASPIRC